MNPPSPPTPADAWTGRLMGGRWRIVSLLDDSGGMATVYLARDEQLPRTAVVKIPKGASLNEEFRARFARESRLHARVSDRNVVQVLDGGEEAGTPYLVLKYLPGGNLKAWCERNPSILADPRLHYESWLLPIAQALDAVAAQGIIHRDVKPTNILFDSGGQAYLSDFGIVKGQDEDTRSKTGMLIGTLQFMSPEQCHEEKRHSLDGRSDQYGLAVTVYQVLTGWKYPVVDDTAVIYAAKFGHSPMKQPREHDLRIPQGVNDAVMRALSPDRDNRFGSSVEFAKAALAGFAKERPRPRPGWGRMAAAGAVLVAAGALALLWSGMKQGLRPDVAGGDSSVKSPVVIRPAVEPVGTAPRVTSLASQAGRFVKNLVGMELVRIPAGRFVMGSPEGESPRDDAAGRFRARNSDEPQIEVTISKPFFIGVREVTETQWEAVMGDQPWNSPAGAQAGRSATGTVEPPRPADANRAVTMSTEPGPDSGWHRAREFCVQLTIRERAAKVISGDQEYRLPTEAEWEYACRAGSSEAYWFGDERGDWSQRAKGANSWGVQGVHLAPWEWCCDEFRAVDDVTGSFPPLRGGEGSRAAERSMCVMCEAEAGFRVVLVRRPDAAGTDAAEERRDNGLSMPLVWVPPGRFTVRISHLDFGTSASSIPDAPGKTATTAVTVTHGFWIGKYEVTLSEWFAVMQPVDVEVCSVADPVSQVTLVVRLPDAARRLGEPAARGGDPVEASIDTGPRAFVQAAPQQEVKFVGFTDVFDPSRTPPASPLVSRAMMLEPVTTTTTSWTNDFGLKWLTYHGQSRWKGRLGDGGRCLFGTVTLFVSDENVSRFVELPVHAGRVSANGRARHPVFSATIEEARRFCERLTDRERRAGRLPGGWEYRLPTEVEWEWAARAGAETGYAFGDDWDEEGGGLRKRCGWFFDFAEAATEVPRAVGLKPGNAWRIFDAYGNVAEWCLCSAATIGGPEDAPARAEGWLRGGSWRDEEPARPGWPGALGGLRVALAPIR